MSRGPPSRKARLIQPSIGTLTSRLPDILFPVRDDFSRPPEPALGPTQKRGDSPDSATRFRRRSTSVARFPRLRLLFYAHVPLYQRDSASCSRANHARTKSSCLFRSPVFFEPRKDGRISAPWRISAFDHFANLLVAGPTVLAPCWALDRAELTTSYGVRGWRAAAFDLGQLLLSSSRSSNCPGLDPEVYPISLVLVNIAFEQFGHSRIVIRDTLLALSPMSRIARTVLP